MQTFNMRYGTGEIRFAFPPHYRLTTIAPHRSEPVEDIDEAVFTALRTPVGSPPPQRDSAAGGLRLRGGL